MSFNDRLAAKLTVWMGSMWCAYLFLLWAMLPIVYAASENLVQYVSQAVIQLVALPLIMVGTSVLSKSTEARAQQDHEALMEEFGELRELVKLAHENQAEMKDVLEAMAGNHR